MRKNIVAGNWKMNMNLQEGIALAKELNEALTADKPNCDVVICTPFIHLASVTPIVDEAIIGVGAENCADKVSGAYTGEVSASMVASTGAKYVILGHSERRAYYGETPEILKEKVQLALANGLTPIFCIGEVLEERNQGIQNQVVYEQLAGSLYDLSAEDFSKIVLAYEPVWAIGTGLTATPEQQKRFMLISVLQLLRSMAMRLQKTHQSFTVVAASQAMQRNFLLTLMSMVVLSVVQLSRLPISRVLSMLSNN